MITRPFVVRCIETAAPGNLVVDVRFSSTTAPSDDGLSLTQRLMSHFVQVAANGGLAGFHIRPVDSTLSLVAEQIAKHACIWKFNSVQIAPSARIVLENIAHFIHLNVSSVSQLDLVIPPGSQMATVQNTTPGLFASPPFQYIFEPEAAEVIIDIDFESPVDDESLRNRFVHFWESWLYVSAVGGFESEDFSSRRITIFPSGEPESYSDQISLYMEDASVSDGAFDILVNGLHNLHFTAAPLRRLHIY